MECSINRRSTAFPVGKLPQITLIEKLLVPLRSYRRPSGSSTDNCHAWLASRALAFTAGELPTHLAPPLFRSFFLVDESDGITISSSETPVTVHRSLHLFSPRSIGILLSAPPIHFIIVRSRDGSARLRFFVFCCTINSPSTLNYSASKHLKSFCD